MAAIQYTDRGTAVRVSPAGRALTEAVLAALDAPSILNTQPWRWRIDGDTAQLRADRSRQLATIDPDGRLLTLSCGAALHHVRVALAADGVAAEVAYLPDGDDPDLLATVHPAGAVERGAQAQRLRRAMSIRRTDRRPFADQDVPEAALDRLRAAAAARRRSAPGAPAGPGRRRRRRGPRGRRRARGPGVPGGARGLGP
ncbi:hypothetical protein OHA72_55340 [Dactylosporangium sp. NBC_01737]|uniref:hypothetical protein n=1 Tax=Dactylosporangium sp. NBC_01737 TaxID=2975959 RepID=UPI002E166894|nr:hypothetical protein OHA72_55340 [Dactylosporangium sp. NBC_01737]